MLVGSTSGTHAHPPPRFSSGREAQKQRSQFPAPYPLYLVKYRGRLLFPFASYCPPVPQQRYLDRLSCTVDLGIQFNVVCLDSHIKWEGRMISSSANSLNQLIMSSNNASSPSRLLAISGVLALSDPRSPFPSRGVSPSYSPPGLDVPRGSPLPSEEGFWSQQVTTAGTLGDPILNGSTLPVCGTCYTSC